MLIGRVSVLFSKEIKVMKMVKSKIINIFMEVLFLLFSFFLFFTLFFFKKNKGILFLEYLLR